MKSTDFTFKLTAAIIMAGVVIAIFQPSHAEAANDTAAATTHAAAPAAQP